MNQLPQTIQQVLNVLSAQFGATGQQLWEVIVRQQYIDGICSAVIVILMPFVLYVCFRWGKHLVKKDDDMDIGWLGVAILTLVAIVCLVGFTYQAITDLANPQYAALQSIAGMINPSSN